MKHRTVAKSSKAFDIKAVDSDDGIYGYVRMSGRQTRYFLKGICSRFLVNPEGTIIYFEKDNLFFYGNTRALAKNFNTMRDYRRIISAQLEAKLPEYQDKPYSPKTMPIDIENDIGFVKIPLEDLLLGTSQQEILARLVAQAEQDLPDLIRTLVKERVYATDSEFMKKFGSIFANFPLELKERALANGCYYRTTQHEYDETIQYMFTPNLRVVSGGLPSLGKRR